MTEWKTEKLSNLLAVSIGGIWGEEAGAAEIDVSVVRVTELKAHGRIDPSSAVTRSVTLKQLASRELQEGDLLLEKSGGGHRGSFLFLDIGFSGGRISIETQILVPLSFGQGTLGGQELGANIF